MLSTVLSLIQTASRRIVTAATQPEVIFIVPLLVQIISPFVLIHT